MTKTDGIQNIQRLERLLRLLPPKASSAEKGIEKAVPRADMGAYQYVFHHAHTPKQADILERP